LFSRFKKITHDKSYEKALLFYYSILLTNPNSRQLTINSRRSDVHLWAPWNLTCLQIYWLHTQHYTKILVQVFEIIERTFWKLEGNRSKRAKKTERLRNGDRMIRRVSSDQGAPGPTGIGCPQGRGILHPFEVTWSFDNMNILLVV
jgi:hypothetical protein